MAHIPKLNLKNDMFYLGINNSHAKLLSLPINMEFEEEYDSINLRGIYSGIFRSCNYDSPY
jgi:hypothetical protein